MTRIRARELRQLFDVIRFAVNGGKGAQEFYDGLSKAIGDEEKKADIVIADNAALNAFLARR